jgi:phosphatidate cytidylyltransferase
MLLSWWTWAILGLFLSLVISYEFSNLLRKTSVNIQHLCVLVSTAILYISVFTFFVTGTSFQISLILISLAIIIVPICSLIYKSSFKDTIMNWIIVFYSAVPFAISALLLWSKLSSPVEMFGFEILHPNYFPKLLLSIFLLIWTFDSFAYISGSLFGKHKILPKVSPKKSWEGFFGGLIISIVLGLLLQYFWGIMIPLEWVGLSLIVAVFGTFGDFMESQLKRMANVKDSGNIMPGHGGLFDRFDSFLMIMPFATVYLILVIL